MQAELIEVSEKVYHDNGFTATPCYSNSIGKLIIGKTPKHAWLAHPKLNPAYESDDASKFALGSVAHAALLQGLDICEPLDFADWRTGASKEARDDAYLAGKIPMLQKQYEQVLAMVSAAKYQIEHCRDLGIQLSDGKGEQTILWNEMGVVSKARLDWVKNDFSMIIDLKTTEIYNPAAWMRSIGSSGYDMQSLFYKRAVKALTGIEPRFIFAVIETSAPYAMYFVELSQAWEAIANEKIKKALKLWETCLSSNKWPMYQQSIMQADPPNFELVDAEEIAVEMQDFNPEYLNA